VSSSRMMLLWGGLALGLVGMLWGLYYALFLEHQMLNRMAGSLVAGFVAASDKNIAQAHRFIHAYASQKYDYVSQVDAHSHWIGLAMLMILLGVALDRVAFSEGMRRGLAIALVLGSVLFPAAVLVETARFGAVVGPVLAIAGSALVTLALGGIAVGFVRQPD
jgi:hypothetical protein